jgi:hypothetical protein
VKGLKAMPHDQPSDDLGDLAQALKQLSPAGRIDRDRVMYLAGRQSVAAAPAGGTWRWPAATALASAIAVALAVLLAVRSDGSRRPAAAEASHISHAPPTLLAAPDQPTSQLRLRQELLSGVWHETPAQLSDSGPEETLRPRDFHRLSRDGWEL